MYVVHVRPSRIFVLAIAVGLFGSGILADPKAHTPVRYIASGILMAMSLLLAFVAPRYIRWSLMLLFTGRGVER